jgi:WD40 repeat protein
VTQPSLDEDVAEDERRYDVFLSYNSVDVDAVEDLARRLTTANLSVWFDRWRITAGDDWQDELADGLARSDGCLVFVGRAGIGDWARQELKVALDRAAKRPSYRVVPVLLPGAGVPFDPTVELPPFLRLRSWLDLRGGLGGDQVVRQVVEAVQGVAPGPPPAAGEHAACPYRGLRPFDEADRDLFFGRDADVAQLLEKLRGSTFLAVLGPSGSGKSSLVKAGLVPALHDGRLPGADRWLTATMRPGARPLVELAGQLTALGHPQATASLLDGLANDDRSLALASATILARHPGADGLLWVVDQLEELFTLVRDGSTVRFICNLVEAAADTVGSVRVVVTMRADFYAKAASFPELAQLMAAHQHLVSPLELEGWRAAIEEPAWRSGLELQSGLVEMILDDAVGRPGSLPLLQEALVALWERRRGNVLTLDGYVSAGRVAGAVAKRADDVYAGLTAPEQATAREVLLRLIQLGEGTEDTRRQAREDELRASGDTATVGRVIERFVEARLLTTATDASGVATVDVAHEALITGWPRLRSWLDENREDLRIRQRLADQAAMWVEQGRDESLLYRGAQLRVAVELQDRGRLDLSGTEREFLEASRDEAHRVAMAAAEAERAELRRAERDRWRRRVMVGLFGLLAVVLALAGVALVQRNEAAQQRERARSLGIASQSEVLAPSQLDLGVLLALQAQAADDGVEATGSLLDALAHAPRPARYLRPPDGARIIAPIALSPAGDRIAAALSDGQVGVWDPRTGDEVAAWPAGQAHGAVTVLAMSPAGLHLAAGHQDGTVAVHDLATGRELGSAAAHGTAVRSLSFASGDAVVSAAGDGPVVTSIGSGGVEAHPVPVTDQAVNAVAVSPDGQRLVTASTDAVRLWTLADGGPLGVLVDASSSFPPSTTTAVAWTEDGTRIAVDVGRLGVFDGQTGAKLADVPAGETTSDVLAVGPTTLLSARGRDVLVLRGDPAVASPTSLTGHTGTVRSVATSSDGSVVVSAAADAVIVWHTGATSPLARTFVPAGDELRAANAVAFLPDEQVAAASGDGVRRWDVASGTEGEPFEAPGGSVTRLAASPSTSELVGGTSEGTLVVWDAATGRIVRRRDGAHDHAVSALAVTGDGRTIASADGAGRIAVWDAASLSPVRDTEHEGGVRALAFSPDGRLVASAGDDRTVRIWRVSDAAPVARLEGHTGMVGSVAFSPDGKLLASGGDDATVRLWDVGSHRELATLAGHTDFVLGLRFTPDGRRLVSTGEDATVILWDVAHRVAIGHPLRTDSASFAEDLDLSPDGRVAASVQGSSVVLWDLDDASWHRQACAIANRPLTPQEQAQYLGDRRPVEVCPPSAT